MTATLPVYKKKDFQSDQDVRWCPGCGDFGILTSIKRGLVQAGLAPHEVLVVSGIGCGWPSTSPCAGAVRRAP